MLETAQVIDA